MRRREFLKAVPALGLLPSARGAAAATIETGSGSSFDPWVELHTENLRRNVSRISTHVGGRPILAVIKNNGYGMGVANVAAMLEPLDAVQGYAVVKLQEAMTLRDAGIRKPVLLMGPFDEKNLEDAVARGITPMIYTPIGKTLDTIARKRQRVVPMHICVDTGIGRVGVPHREAEALIRDLAARDSTVLQGVMMTFAEDAAFDEEQKRRFKKLTKELSASGLHLGQLHADSSFGLFLHPDFFLDMVRPGMAIYGVYSEQPFRTMDVLDLTPALALKSARGLREAARQGRQRRVQPCLQTGKAHVGRNHPGRPHGWSSQDGARRGQSANR